MRKNLFLVFFVAILTTIPAFSPAFADTFYVPDNFLTIQEALDGCVGGDTIIVRDGIYTGPQNKNLDFKGKALTLLSENGKENCIIYCEGNGRGFYFHTGETSESIVDGFTVINGSVPSSTLGGGFYCYNSSPTIANCTISYSVAGKGGGIGCQWFASPTIINCTIENNSADYFGGGISLWSYASPDIAGCTISGNTAPNGAGVSCVYSSSPTMTNCAIKGNTASTAGGGIDGFSRCSPALVNCTIKENDAGSGGGSSFSGASAPAMANCILWGNTAVFNGPQIALQYSSSLNVSYTDVEGGPALSHMDLTSSLDWGEGNIDSDPVFSEDGDHHIAPASPCVDTGMDAGVYEDIDGDARPQGTGYDMGSDEVSLALSEDNDGDGYGSDIDCNDDDPTVYPGAPEICDGKDNDCDESVPLAESDDDADGYMVCEGDCDDADSGTYPGAPELCDGTDNDCDGSVPLDESDADFDGYMVCAGDCDDTDPSINPEAYEIPGNEIDENCDGFTGACDPNADWKNHGQYVRCVVHEVRDLVMQGVMTREEAMAVITEAAKSDVGKK
jgi:parallel beta-helix repeat protein